MLMWRTKNKFSASLTAWVKAALSRLQPMRQKESLLKKYLVVKMAEGWSHVVNWVVMPGLYTMEAAQQFVDSAIADEPGARYMIQEVGAA
jgi:hypothetical protein